MQTPPRLCTLRPTDTEACQKGLRERLATVRTSATARATATATRLKAASRTSGTRGAVSRAAAAFRAVDGAAPKE
eukprot:2719204-Pleurochrysis_carterae.AAC.1